MAYPIRLENVTTCGQRLRTVHLPHDPVHAEMIVELRESMMVAGWTGRPVILADAGDHHIALTGTHRLCAVQGLDCEVDAVLLPDDLSEDDWSAINGAHDDDELVAALEQIAAERDDMDDVVAAMRAEVASNAAA